MALASCEIRPSPLHGLGIFATERIEKGAIIIREEALWVVNKLQAMEATFPGLSDVEQMRKNMIDAFKPPISPATREFTNGVLSLAGGFDLNDRVDKDPTAAMIELTTTLREVLIRNGVTMDFRPHQDYVCVFKDASRLNHSCMANAVRTVGYSPDPLGFICQVVADKAVAKGEEILINYNNPTATFKDRQENCQTRWKFTCTCERCSRPENERQKSDANRAKLADLLQEIRDSVTERKWEPTSEKSRKMYHRNLEASDKWVTGEGWPTLDKLAAEEGIHDFFMFAIIIAVSDAAQRSRKMVLETKLVDRILTVYRTFRGVTPEQEREMIERREILHKKASILASIAGSKF